MINILLPHLLYYFFLIRLTTELFDFKFLYIFIFLRYTKNYFCSLTSKANAIVDPIPCELFGPVIISILFSSARFIQQKFPKRCYIIQYNTKKPLRFYTQKLLVWKEYIFMNFKKSITKLIIWISSLSHHPVLMLR